MTDLTSLYTLSYQLLILLTVLVSKATVSHFISHEPLHLFQFYCQKLSDKVNKPQNSAQQQTIAGLVAIIVTLAPIIVILWLFEFFIEVPWLWQGFLLYFALGPFNLMAKSKAIAQALVANQNYLAKQTLKPLMLREIEPLSKMGLSKSCIEMQLLKTLQQTVVVVFYFFLFGPLAAVSYRLILEMHYSWNIKQVNFRHFGRPASVLINVMQWLPIRIFTLMMLLMHSKQNLLLTWRLIRGKFFQLNNDIALHCFALNLQIKLGSVAMYHKVKLRKPSFNDQARQPEPTDIIHASNQLKYTLIMFGLLLLMLCIVSIIVQS